ncbi:MAG: VCBS repeat-containing protein [Ignavibacteria bacterium]|nr:VCBS repeat-containing protein [Ignavibacteria bacterium]MDP3831181.1 VCBS repeat-containing protein [Ignavibacteriaceae bacterium]
MKKDDLKKHYKEEKTDSSSEEKIFKFFFWILLLLPHNVSPQFYLNGFCKYDSFQIPSEGESFFALNFNGDSFNDFLILANSKKTASTLIGENEGKFKNGYNNFSFPPINSLSPIYDFYAKAQSHVYSLRASNTVGFVRFRGNGNPTFSKKFKFNSYPEKISTADIDKNGRTEILVSGASFEGLSILYQTEKGLAEKKIYSKESFSQSVFIDLNDDGYADIVAFELSTYSLYYFYNNTRGGFRLERKVVVQQPIFNLQTVDFNLDSYPDLLFTTGKSIIINYGDPISSFEKQTIIKVKHNPSKLIYGDFNRDGRIGLVYLSKENSSISILFKKDDETLQDETVYFTEKGLVDLIPFYSRFIDGFAALSKDGKIHLFSKLISFSNYAKLYFGGKADKIVSFDYSDNGIYDISFINTDNNTFNLVLRNNSGIPIILYSIPAYLNYQNYTVDDRQPFVKTFYFYNEFDRVIELLEVDLKAFSYKRNYIYTDGSILDLRIINNPEEQKSSIHVVHLKEAVLSSSLYTYKDFRYSAVTSSNLAANVITAKTSGSSFIYYWQKEDDKNSLFVLSPTEKLKSTKIFSYKAGKTLPEIRILFDIFNSEKEVLVTTVINDGESAALFAKEDFTGLVKFDDENKDFFSKNGMLYGGDFKPNSLNKLFLYLPDKKSLNSVQYLKKKNRLVISRIHTIKDLHSFIVQKFSANNYYVIYSLSEEKCLIFERL